jgi:ketosteroid isomerase-like protein
VGDIDLFNSPNVEEDACNSTDIGALKVLVTDPVVLFVVIPSNVTFKSGATEFIV